MKSSSDNNTGVLMYENASALSCPTTIQLTEYTVLMLKKLTDAYQFTKVQWQK